MESPFTRPGYQKPCEVFDIQGFPPTDQKLFRRSF
jgi:hypothetical protein